MTPGLILGQLLLERASGTKRNAHVTFPVFSFLQAIFFQSGSNLIIGSTEK